MLAIKSSVFLGEGALVEGVDPILTPTTRDHTMLRGAYEAVYYGTSIIISDWPILRETL